MSVSAMDSLDLDARRAALAFRAREIGVAAEHHRALQAAIDALGRRRAHG